MAGALTPKQRAIVEATDKALDEFGKQIVAVWFQSGTDRGAAMAGAVKCERSGASRTECGCPGCYDYRNCLVKRVDGKWCSQSDLDAAMAGKMKCDECGVVCGHGWRCSKFPVRAQAPSPYVDPNDPRRGGGGVGFKYDESHIPTERLGVPTAPARCECGSGSNEASGAHSHWCPRWVRP